MNTIEIKKQNALKAYKEADAKGKTLLENLIGKEHLSEDITKRIRSFADVCAEAGEDPANYVIPEKATIRQRGIILFSQLQLICEVFREGVVFDYANSKQQKYWPWFDFKAGSGFSAHNYGYDFTYASVGARLSVDTAAKAKYIGEQFGDIYNEYLQWV